MKVPILCVVLGSAVGGVKVATGIVLSGSAHNRHRAEQMWEKCEAPPIRGIALIQVRQLLRATARIREEEPALLDRSDESSHSRGSPVLGPVKPTSNNSIIHILGIKRDDLCPARGDNAGVGCAVGCRCGWWKQCYPKTMFVLHSGQRSKSTSQDAGSQIQVGICDLAPPVLVLLSVFILLGTILFFAVVKFVAMLPGHYGFEPKHREVHKPRGQGEDRMGWRSPHPPMEDPRRFQLQKEQQQQQEQEQQQGERRDDKTDDTQAVEVQEDWKRRQQSVSLGASSAESPVSQIATFPSIPDIVVTTASSQQLVSG